VPSVVVDPEGGIPWQIPPQQLGLVSEDSNGLK
jgi:hypothetical protein